MSLLKGGATPSTVFIHEVTRNRRNESFGDSVFNDAAEAMGPASKLVNGTYRRKALKAVEKRNQLFGCESEYINYLCNVTVGDSISVEGNMAEANLFGFIQRFCNMEIMVQKRNNMLGNVNPKIQEKLQNPPDLSMSHMARINYINVIEGMAQMDMAKVGAAKVGNWLKAKKEEYGQK